MFKGIKQIGTTNVDIANPLFHGFVKSKAPNFKFEYNDSLILNIPTIYCWFRTDKGECFNLTNLSINTWYDHSGNNRHGSQATSTAKPTLTYGFYNGYNAVYFDGNDFLSLGALSKEANYTTFVVGYTTDNTSNCWFFGSMSSDGWTTKAWNSIAILNTGGVAGRMAYYFGDSVNVNGSRGHSTVQNAINNKFGLFNLKYTSGQNYCDLYYNGIPQTITKVLTSNTSTSGTAYGLSIGREGDFTGGGYLNGYILEIISYNTALSDGDRLIITNYLKSKYKI